MISATQLLVDKLAMKPVGSEIATKDGRCVMCGGEYAAGEMVEPWAPGDSFTEFSDLQYPAGTHICGACKAAWRKEFMQGYTKAVVCDGGLYGFFSNDAVAHWLTNPPPPPYLMVISTQQLGHIYWKAPVNYSQSIMRIRYNDKVLVVRRDHLAECVGAVRALSEAKLALEAAEEAARVKAGKPAKRGKPVLFRSPIRLDRKLEQSDHGLIEGWARDLALGDPALMRAVETLEQATSGEVWGLAHVLHAKNPAAELKLKPGDIV